MLFELPSTTPSAPTNKPVQEKIINVDRLIEVLSNKDEEISEILNQVLTAHLKVVLCVLNFSLQTGLF